MYIGLYKLRVNVAPYVEEYDYGIFSSIDEYALNPCIVVSLP